MRGVTEADERHLWDELSGLVADLESEAASPEDAERAVLLAVMGINPEVKELYDRVKVVARAKAGYLRERMEEDNPVAVVRRRLRIGAL